MANTGSQRKRGHLDPAAARAIACPVDRAARISAYARRHGTLPGDLAQLRREAIVEALLYGANGARVTMLDLAKAMRVHLSRVCQLRNRAAADA